MKVIKRQKVELFDDIIKDLDINEKERLYFSYAIFNLVSLKKLPECNAVTNEAIDTMLSAIEKFIKSNNREVDIYSKMLRLIKLKITNDTFDQFLKSEDKKMFDRIIAMLKMNQLNRVKKTQVEMTKCLCSLYFDTAQIKFFGNDKQLQDILTDDVYNYTMNKIPTK